MTQATYDVLGIGNAIVDILARTDEAFLGAQGMAKGSMSLIDEARAAAIYKAMGPAVEISGGSAANTIVGRRRFRRARRICRQGQEGSAGRRLQPRHPRGEGDVRNQGGERWSGHRLQLHPGDAGRRADHEHLSGRCAKSAPERYRCGTDRGGVHHLSGRLPVGSEGCQGRLRQGGDGRARRRSQGRADTVGCILRRPLSWRVSAI